MANETVRRFREWFWRPPRAHGEVEHDRTVSHLELLYDLVYVVAVSQAAQHLSDEVSASRVIEFAIVFTMVWIAWINGTLYLELHGREDGRTRVFVFIQMGIVALLAVFIGIAGEDLGGARFALTYVAFLGTLIWLWESVRRRDAPEEARATLVYVLVLVLAAAVILASAFLEPGARLIAWAAFGAVWILAMIGLGHRSKAFQNSVVPTRSLIERLGLFMIIVLGEVVFGVVEGISNADQDAISIGTGIAALGIGLGFWWIYFDLVGRRAPTKGSATTVWILSHLPITLATAAAGAGMVSLIAHANEPQALEPTAWLLTGSVAVVLLAEIVHSRALEDAQKLSATFRAIGLALGVAAVAALLVGWLRPSPLVMVLSLDLILTVLWIFAVVRFIRARAWPPA